MQKLLTPPRSLTRWRRWHRTSSCRTPIWHRSIVFNRNNLTNTRQPVREHCNRDCNIALCNWSGLRRRSLKPRKSLCASFLNTAKTSAKPWTTSVSNRFEISEELSVVRSDKAFWDSPRSVYKSLSFERPSSRFHPKVAYFTLTILKGAVAPWKGFSLYFNNDSHIFAKRAFFSASTHWSWGFFMAGNKSAIAFYFAENFRQPLMQATLTSFSATASKSVVASFQSFVASSTGPSMVRSSRFFPSTLSLSVSIFIQSSDTSAARGPITLALACFYCVRILLSI